MTLTQLRCFEAVCQTMSYSRAANALYVSQPAISKSISKLEQELGIELFRPVGHTLVLTEAGELFLAFVRQLHSEYDLIRKQLADLKDQEGKTFRLGCPETWNPTFFSRQLEACFSEANPGCRLELEARKLSDLLEALQSGSLDMVISHDFYSPSIPGLNSRTLTETRTGILYARDRFLEPVTFEALASAGFVLFDPEIEKRFGAVIQEICSRRGIEPRIVSRLQITRALFEVARGSGVMLFTEWDSAVGNSAYGYYPLEDTLPVKLLFYPERLDPLGRRFITAADTIDWSGG